MKITVVGPGAMGLLFAGMLSKKHELVLVCRRKEQAQAIQDFKTTTNVRRARADLFLLTTKAYDAFDALKQIRQSHPTTPVLAIQNGLLQFSDENVVRGVTTYAATRKSDSESVMTAEGELLLEKTVFAQNIVMAFHESGVRTEIVGDIDRFIWEKFFINVGINALGAVTGKKNGELVEDEKLRKRMKALVSEAVLVSKLGFDEDEVFDKTVLIARNTSKNKSSMLQDVESGRKTEIKFLNDAVCTMGRMEGISTPENKKLVREVKWLEKINPV